MIGQVLDGKYQVARLIGEGGMGAVYEATGDGVEGRVAVKVISDEAVAQDEVLVTRFEREADAASKIVSPHIVEIYDAGHDSATGHPYMVMEMLDGENAQQLLARLGPLPVQLAVRLAIQTCEGLARAHEAGVVHRDIKPANLFLAEKGDEIVVKLLDFGVAKLKMDQASESANQSLTRTGSMLGSPMYMSPEQARGLKTIDHRADIWSLGTVMYQLLAGRLPHEDIDGLGELIITICSEPPAPIDEVAPWVPAKLAKVIARALELPPDERYQSADEMAAALRTCLEGDDATLRKDMFVPLDDADKAPAAGESASVEHDQTVALEQAPAPGGGDLGIASTLALSPEELEVAAAIDRGEAPPKDAQERASEDGASEDGASEDGASEDGASRATEEREDDDEQRRRDERVLAKHRDAQRAALDAARLSDDKSSGGNSRYVMLLVIIVLGLGVLFLYMRWMAQPADGGSAPPGETHPEQNGAEQNGAGGNSSPP